MSKQPNIPRPLSEMGVSLVPRFPPGLRVYLFDLRSDRKVLGTAIGAPECATDDYVILARLGLEPIDVNIVLHLLRFWIKELPFPSQKTLARAIGVHPRTVRRRLNALKDLGYLKTTADLTTRGKVVTRYDLRPLIEHAKRVISLRPARKEQE